PDDFEALLKGYTQQGYRVIALAWRQLRGEIGLRRLTRMRRAEVETDLIFLGFLVFENKLKPETAPVVKQLHEANIRQVMCTGDNVLTAVSVSRKCGLISSRNPVYTLMPHSDVFYDWVALDEGHAPEVPGEFPSGAFDLAIDGNAFQWLLDREDDSLLSKVLVKAQVFARMSPEQKHVLVERLQDLGYCVGFCGDGANDVGALKGADVGVSLSEAEASAAAPFTSQRTDVSCVPALVREGRAALATSFGAFAFMAAYSLVQFASVLAMYAVRSNLADLQFLLVDIGIILPVAVGMSESGPSRAIHTRAPTASLVSRRVLVAVIGLVAVQVVFQAAVFAWVRTADWYAPPPSRGNDDDGREAGHGVTPSLENTCVFLVSCFQYVFVALRFCAGPPHRESVWLNGQFVFTTALLLFLLVALVVSPPPVAVAALGLLPLPAAGRAGLLGLVALDWITTWACDAALFPALLRTIKVAERAAAERRFLRRPRGELDEVGAVVHGRTDAARLARRERWGRKGKLYKVVEDDLTAA
ncbi:hypothetical protein HK405_003856, partial [Cladochytrium tenue]